MIRADKKDIIWSYVGTICTLLSQAVWLPIILFCVNTNELGLWYIFVSMGAISSLLDMGFSSQISRAVVYAWTGAEELKKTGVEEIHPKDGRHNFVLVKSLMRTCRLLYLSISFLAAVAMIVAGYFYLHEVVDTSDIYNVDAAWFIYIASVCLNLCWSYYPAVLLGIGDVSSYNRANVISKVVLITFGSALLASGCGIMGLCIATLASGVSQKLISRYWLEKKHSLFSIFSALPENSKYNSPYLLKTLWHNAWRDGLVTISLYATTQASVLISGAFFALEQSAVYSISMQIINSIISLARGMAAGYMPSIQSAFAERNIKEIKGMVSRSVVSYYAVCISGIAIFELVGFPLLRWIKPELAMEQVFFAVLAVHLIMMDKHRLSAAFISAQNMLPFTVPFIVSAFACVVVSYLSLSVFGMGLYGLVLMPFAVQCSYNNWKWNMEINKTLGTSEYSLFVLGVKYYVGKLKNKINF